MGPTAGLDVLEKSVLPLNGIHLKPGQDASVSRPIMTRLRTGLPENWGRYLSVPYSLWTVSRSHPDSYPVGTGHSFLGGIEVGK